MPWTFQDYNIEIGNYIVWRSDEESCSVSLVVEANEYEFIIKDVYGPYIGQIETIPYDWEWTRYSVRIFKTKEELELTLTEEAL